jgi:hypothetical protein
MPTRRGQGTQHGRGTRSERGGYVLVFVAMLMFAFFGLAALVADLGMTRLTQLQMQSAADSAALEGLRFRDEIPAAWWAQYASQVEAAVGQSLDPTNALDRDLIRRWAASYMVANIFDDDMNPSDVDTSGDLGQSGNWGAGPVLQLSGGYGADPSLAASQLLQVPAPGQRAYKPSLQMNAVNEQYGDMVSGAYGLNSGYAGTYPYFEDSQYNRADFESAASPTGSETAFLARLRRTNDLQGLDNQSGISSAGPTIPFLFGRGSVIHQQTGSSYSPRQQGMTIRGTGLANAQPAVAVGPAISGQPVNVEGLSNVSVTQGFWETINVGNTASYPPAFQIEPTDNQQTTLTINGPASGSLLPVPGGSFLIRIDSEIMAVNGPQSTSTSWSVARGAAGTQPAAHASTTSARLLPSLSLDNLGHLLDTPVAISGGGTKVLTLAAANRLMAFGSSGTSVFDPTANPPGFPILTSSLGSPSSGPAIVSSISISGGALRLSCTQNIAGGTVDLIVAAEDIQASAEQISVTAPADVKDKIWYFDSPAEPALGEILLVHDVGQTSDSSAEYVRVTNFTTPQGAGNYQYTLTVERGLFGTAAGTHTGSTIALTPVAGCVFGTATLAASIGASDDTISLTAGSGFPLRQPDASSQLPLFMIQIDQEILGVTGAANSTGQQWSPRSWSASNGMPTAWSVQRGMNGTTPSAHTPAPNNVAYCDSLSFGDPLQAASQNASPTVVTGVLPICDDFGSSLGAAICGFGRAMVASDATVSGNYLIMPLPGANPTDPASGTVATNSAASFDRPFAADLAATALQSSLWQAMMTQLVDSTGSRLPRNPVLAPVLMSTNLPPQPAASP